MARPVTFAPFDVVVVPFPYSDALAEKRRPAVVVSAPDVEAERGAVWLAMITSTPGPLLFGDAAVTDLETAGLSKSCRVRASKIATLDADRVLRRVGALGPVDQAAVARSLRACAAFAK